MMKLLNLWSEKLYRVIKVIFQNQEIARLDSSNFGFMNRIV